MLSHDVDDDDDDDDENENENDDDEEEGFDWRFVFSPYKVGNIKCFGV